jgi:hypothetical protein
MIHPDFSQCRSLQELYDQACVQFTAQYGEHFVLYWEEIKRLAQYCDSYKELGAFQGVSAAAAMLGNPNMKFVELIDVTFERLVPHRHVFRDFPGHIEFSEHSSIDPSRPIKAVDMMLVDSLHTVKHIKTELKMHAPMVNQYIVFHDARHPPIKKIIDDFVEHTTWQYLVYDDRSFGYAVIEKAQP